MISKVFQAIRILNLNKNFNLNKKKTNQNQQKKYSTKKISSLSKNDSDSQIIKINNSIDALSCDEKLSSV